MEIPADRRLRNALAVSAMALTALLTAAIAYRAQAQSPSLTQAASPPTDPRVFLNTYCVGCHSQKTHTAGLDLETIDAANLAVKA